MRFTLATLIIHLKPKMQRREALVELSNLISKHSYCKPPNARMLFNLITSEEKDHPWLDMSD